MRYDQSSRERKKQCVCVCVCIQTHLHLSKERLAELRVSIERSRGSGLLDSSVAGDLIQMVNESASLSLALAHDCGESIELVRRTRDKNTRDRMVTKNIKSRETVPLLK